MRASLVVCLSVLLPGLATAGRVDYTRDVKPLLARRCVACHGPAKQRSGLRLDSGAGILKGGDTGPAVVPHKSAGSLLIRAVTGAEGVSAMPPKGPRLSAGEVTLLRDWIDAGIPMPGGTVPLNGTSALFTISTLSVGTHSITAAYSGDAKFAAITSAALNEVVR